MADEVLKKTDELPIPKYAGVEEGYLAALKVVDDVILRNYVTGLSGLEIVEPDPEELQSNIDENVLLFKIDEMVYGKEEFASHRFASVFNTLSSSNTSVFIILDSDGEKTDFYMGIRSLDPDRTTSSVRKTLENAMIGQFPGIKTRDQDIDEMKRILSGIKGNSISAVSCIANSRDERLNNNREFVQGLEKLVLSMQGQKYTGIILADSTDQTQLRELRKGYESVYTRLSPFAGMQVNYGRNSSVGKTEGISDARTESRTETRGRTETEGTTDTHGKSKENGTARVIKGVAAAGTMLGAALAPVTGGFSLAAGGVVSGSLGMLGSALTGTVSESSSGSSSVASSDSTALTDSGTHTYSSGVSVTKSRSDAVTLTAHDKSVENILSRIDRQLERLDEFESLGMYECAAYFLSEDQYAAEIAAATYSALMRGEGSGVEIAAVNSWGRYEKDKTELIERYVKNFIHPVFKYSGALGNIEVTPGSMVSGNELAIHMGLPRKSVCGLPVIEHADFGKEVVRYDRSVSGSSINLGKIFNMGSAGANDVRIDKASLSMHTFVTGSTGSGKSNTVYELIRQSANLGASFMVIEPAKGEYKNIFGNRADVEVYGTNPEYSGLLRINPFRFPDGVHILEHVDRLTEIFNVCWPMYAAMPAVLKDALLQAYEVCGWDFSTSENRYDDQIFPTFSDLLNELVNVINGSAYSEEVKSNYTGSLVTRVRSLTNGLNGQIFGSVEIDSEDLFDRNVIIDLSRVGSPETKSLIMGILIMRLGEYRMSVAANMNQPFRHLTVLEEAHNILKRTSAQRSAEGADLAGKAVEMISNAIAEMRTYGEGFVIVDQSPSAVDLSAIRNTNTKIIMRLPDENDRRIAGKSAGLKDEQLDEIAKLPKGVAVVYQNDWVEAVLCSIQKYRGEEEHYCYTAPEKIRNTDGRLRKRLLQFLLRTRVRNPFKADPEEIRSLMEKTDLSGRNRVIIRRLLSEYERGKELSVWKEERFGELAGFVSGLLESKIWLRPLIDNADSFHELTEELMKRVEGMAPGIGREYSLAAAQCLLKNAAGEGDGYKEIYAAWVTDLRKRGVV